MKEIHERELVQLINAVAEGLLKPKNRLAKIQSDLLV